MDTVTSLYIPQPRPTPRRPQDLNLCRRLIAAAESAEDQGDRLSAEDLWSAAATLLEGWVLNAQPSHQSREEVRP